MARGRPFQPEAPRTSLGFRGSAAKAGVLGPFHPLGALSWLESERYASLAITVGFLNEAGTIASKEVEHGTPHPGRRG